MSRKPAVGMPRQPAGGMLEAGWRGMQRKKAARRLLSS